MPRLAVVFGLLLIALGVGGYVFTGAASATALIPAFFGLPMAGLGALALWHEPLRMHAMHGAALLGILGVAGNAGAFAPAFRLLVGGQVERPAAVVLRVVMAVLCAVFTVLCVKSFVDARRARAKDGGEA